MEREKQLPHFEEDRTGFKGDAFAYLRRNFSESGRRGILQGPGSKDRAGADIWRELMRRTAAASGSAAGGTPLHEMYASGYGAACGLANQASVTT